MEFIEGKHSGGVVSRIIPNAFVEEPIAITVEGRTTDLIPEDARALADGLLSAIKEVEEHQSEVGKQEHFFCLGKTKKGMSPVVQSKLGVSIICS